MLIIYWLRDVDVGDLRHTQFCDVEVLESTFFLRARLMENLVNTMQRGGQVYVYSRVSNRSRSLSKSA